MDAVYCPDGRTWVSKPLNVRDYFSEYAEKLKSSCPRPTKKLMRSAAKYLDADNALVRELDSVCSPKNLLCEDEFNPIDVEVFMSTQAIFEDMPITEAAKKNLKSLQVKDKLEREGPGKLSNTFQREWILPDDVNAKRLFPSVNCEILLVAKIYNPKKYNAGAPGATFSKELQEVLVLGRNSLTQLRDRIICPADLMHPGDISNCSGTDTKQRCKDVYKSGFFYFEGTFYSDMRHKDCIDYSEVIRSWSLETNRKVGPFDVARMEETKFNDLTLRLGFPYVYQHQGNCEHPIVFTSIRLLHPTDSPLLKNYPRLSCISGYVSRYCMMCSMFMARYMTTNNERVPQDPFLWCNHCFKAFNYKDGKKIGNFRAYTFFDRSAII